MGIVQNPGEKEGQTDGNRATQEDQIIKRNRGAKEGGSFEGEVGHHRADQRQGTRASEENRGAGTRGTDPPPEDEGAAATRVDRELSTRQST